MYYVIGGQYRYHYYGSSKTIRGAKMLATRNKEYWGNFVGWVTPRIYSAEPVITTVNGDEIVLPIGECSYYHDGKKWRENK